jgi:hypothetical protein
VDLPIGSEGPFKIDEDEFNLYIALSGPLDGDHNSYLSDKK